MSVFGPKEVFHNGTTWRRNDKFLGRYDNGTGLTKSFGEIQVEKNGGDSPRMFPSIVSPEVLGNLLLLPFILIVLYVGIFAIPLAWCLSLWQRILLHPRIVRKHLSKARLVFFAGVVVTSIYSAAGFLNLHNWETGQFHTVFFILGLYLLVIAIPTIAIGWLQLWLSNRYPQLCCGNGYGLANLYCLFVKSARPRHFLTFLLDFLWIFLLVHLLVVAYPPKEEFGSFSFYACMLIITFSHNWLQDYKSWGLKIELPKPVQKGAVSTAGSFRGWETRNGKYVDDPFT